MIGKEYEEGVLNNGRTKGNLGNTLHSGTFHGQQKAATAHCMPDWWILLDNQLTIDTFCNKALLPNIQKAPSSCNIICNAGQEWSWQISLAISLGGNQA